jgi:hypothetical protein
MILTYIITVIPNSGERNEDRGPLPSYERAFARMGRLNSKRLCDRAILCDTVDAFIRNCGLLGVAG